MNRVFLREKGLRVSLALTLIVVAVIGLIGARHGYGGWGLVVTLAALSWLLWLYFALGLMSRPEPGRRPADALFSLPLVITWLILPYLLYALVTATFDVVAFLKLCSYASAPLMMLFFFAHGRQRLAWSDMIALLAIWFPIEFHWLSDAWIWPRSEISNVFNTLLAVDVGVIGFVVFRGLEGVGYRFRLRWVDLKAAGLSFLLFLGIAVPLGSAVKFLGFNPRMSLPTMLGLAVGLFLITGIPEELLFRGIIQNLLQKTLGHRWVALVLAALIFGAAHLDNGDWRFFSLASLAGLFYGWAYQRTEGLMAPAIAHALVDAVWSAYLRR